MDIQTSFSPQIAQFAPPKPVSGILADYWGVDSKSPHFLVILGCIISVLSFELGAGQALFSRKVSPRDTH